MSGIINLLPNSVANQIAAGEVIQRPASVVKELVENSVDSGADSITVNVKDAGKTLIQVIDNGCGMSETDARICWERHSTSKIKEANDLFAIRTKGFRGEALASIAAISEVTLKTRRKEDELGTLISISGSEIRNNEPVACTQGCNFSIRNLFFNVPARRKFLKTNTTELRHIINEFNHVALAHPNIEFSLLHNNSQIFNLSKSNLRQRILGIFGKNINNSLITVEAVTSLIEIRGFIGKPETAKKTFGEQFFFVNGRYIRHPYLHKAITQAYENILPPDTIPAYFIYFSIDPDKIDINIHPTKTEMKFEDEQAIWQILRAVIKESIGKNNLSPSLDFGSEGVIDIPVLKKNIEIKTPGINVNPDYNPFTEDKRTYQGETSFHSGGRNIPKDWEKLYDLRDGQAGPENHEETAGEQIRFLQFKNKYILTPVKSGLMIIDQKRAHERILFEQNLRNLHNRTGTAQTTLFPESIELNQSDFVIFKELLPELNSIGFDIREFGKHSIIVNGVPEYVKNSDLNSFIDEMIENYKNYEASPGTEVRERIAASLAKASAIPYGKVLEKEEMREIVDQLFACENPNYSPSGKKVINIQRIEEIEKLLN